MVTVPTTVQKQARVLGHMLGGIAPRLLIASYFGSEAWIGKNVPTVKSFVSAINRGIDAHNANLDEAWAMIAKYTGLKPELLKEMPLPAFEKKLLESDLEPMLEVGLRYKFSEAFQFGTALYWAKSKGFSCRALSFNYGQRHTVELGFAEKLARRAGCGRQSARSYKAAERALFHALRCRTGSAEAAWWCPRPIRPAGTAGS